MRRVKLSVFPNPHLGEVEKGPGVKLGVTLLPDLYLAYLGVSAERSDDPFWLVVPYAKKFFEQATRAEAYVSPNTRDSVFVEVQFLRGGQQICFFSVTIDVKTGRAVTSYLKFED